MVLEQNNHEYIETFRPIIRGLDSATEAELSLFHAGDGYEFFDDYIYSEAKQDAVSGDGTTHIIWNKMSENKKEMVAYFTLSVNVIPYDDGIEDEEFSFSNYPAIPVFEIRMFAVSEKYQDVFFKNEIDDLPIAAWCIKAIESFAINASETVVGAKALFLHALPSAEEFYLLNDFSKIPSNAKPLFSVDKDYTAMWYAFKEVLLQND